MVYTATTTLNGSFGISNTVRQGVYGPLILTAIGQSSHRQASAPFAIKAETLPRTISAKPGGRIVLSGYGFGAHETVKATWAPGNLPLGHATTNSLGTFAGGAALTVTVPLSPTGTYHVYAVGATSRAVAGCVVTLVPSLMAIQPVDGLKHRPSIGSA